MTVTKAFSWRQTNGFTCSLSRRAGTDSWSRLTIASGITSRSLPEKL
jgi:hypothetical protein